MTRIFFSILAFLSHSYLTNSCGVKKSACLSIICECMKRNLPWSGSRVQIAFYCNIVLLFVPSSHMISPTIENTLLLWRRIHIRSLEQLHERFWWYRCTSLFWKGQFLHAWNINKELFFFPSSLRNRKATGTGPGVIVQIVEWGHKTRRQ